MNVVHTVMLQYFACEKPLRFCHFAANSSTLRSWQRHSHSRPISAEVGMYLTLLGLLLAGLLLQRTLHTLHVLNLHRCMLMITFLWKFSTHLWTSMEA